MHKLSEFLVAAATCFLPLEALGVEAENADEVAAHSSPWPMQIVADGRTVVVHSPQFESWENYQLQGRAAVSLQVEGAEQPNFGVIRFTARTETDTANQVVTIRDIAIGSADFPAANDRAADYLELLRRHLRSLSWNIALQRLRSDLAIDRAMQQARRQPLRNDPPRIIFTERPAILVPVDGTPALRALPDSGLMRVVNTRALILFDKTVQHYYLFIAGRWMTAQSLDGPWAVIDSVPAQLQRAKELAAQKDQFELLEADDEQSRFASAAPAVYVSTRPAELLQTDGSPEYAPIENTQLLYVTNSPNKIFLDLVTQQHYALISGRWLRAPRLEQESWQYVSGAELPADFAMIPPDHPMAVVRAAVPGTPQAQEAVIANSVPQVASVRRSTASLEITYDGEATFRPIAGTSLQYAVNAPIPVISVGENDYYALDIGVWFAASSPYGPWSVASYVPPVIYSIPRSSPLHYVTYVRVYDDTPETVYVGYTPGYVGSYVAGDGVVVYGTGWAYRPWIGSVWYGPPVTWGHGFTVIYSWWNPWWPQWTVAWPYYPCFRPWWGPWIVPVVHTRTVVVGAPVTVVKNVTINNINVTNVYKRWGPRVVAWDGSRSGHTKRVARMHGDLAPGTGIITDSEGRVHRIGGRDEPRNFRGHSGRLRNRDSLPPLQVTRPRAQWDTTVPSNLSDTKMRRSQPADAPLTPRGRDAPSVDRQHGTQWRGLEHRIERDRALPLGRIAPPQARVVQPPVEPLLRAQPEDQQRGPERRMFERRIERDRALPLGRIAPQRRESARPPNERALPEPIARQRRFTVPTPPDASAAMPRANAGPRARDDMPRALPGREAMVGPGESANVPQTRSFDGRRGEGAGRGKSRSPSLDLRR